GAQTRVDAGATVGFGRSSTAITPMSPGDANHIRLTIPRRRALDSRPAVHRVREVPAMQTVALKPTPAVRWFDSRVLLTLLIIAVTCGVFWLGSPYPSLQSKAGADPDEALSTPLGFESHFPEPRSDERLKRVGWVAAEWAITNKQGMTFGILLAAGLLT